MPVTNTASTTKCQAKKSIPNSLSLNYNAGVGRMNWDSSPTQVFSDNQMTSITDGVVIFCIAATLIIFDAFLTLLSILKKGIFGNQKRVLIKQTNKELKSMLTGVKKISNLNKQQLVELILVGSKLVAAGLFLPP